MINDSYTLIRGALPLISRTFALPMSYLDYRIEKVLGTAYSLDRLIDTVEDSPISEDSRQKCYDSIKTHIMLEKGRELTSDEETLFGSLETASASVQDRTTARIAPLIASSYHSLEPRMKAIVRGQALSMIEGMRNSFPINTMADQDRYCHIVAGTVGEMITAVFREAGAIADADYGHAMKLAAGFGLGLQKVNIIKDVHEDVSRGAYYWPQDVLSEKEISAKDLIAPDCRQASLEALALLADDAQNHLNEGLSYTLMLQKSKGPRMFCVLPLLFAVATLSRVRENPSAVFEAGVKISREEVAGIVSLAEKSWGDDVAIEKSYSALSSGYPGRAK